MSVFREPNIGRMHSSKLCCWKKSFAIISISTDTLDINILTCFSCPEFDHDESAISIHESNHVNEKTSKIRPHSWRERGVISSRRTTHNGGLNTIIDRFDPSGI